MAKHLC